MAGLSSRFSREGFRFPKYELPLIGGSVFDHVLHGLAPFLNEDQFIFVCRTGQEGRAARYVRQRCNSLGVRDFTVVELAQSTRGQAETVALGLRHAGVHDGDLWVFNIDTFRHGLTKAALDGGVVGGLETFVGEGDGWSFVRPSATLPGRVQEVREKQRISQYCCTGLYAFASAGAYLDVFDEYALSSPASWDAGELYVAPIYNLMLRDELSIGFTTIAAEAVTFCGTPEEYLALIKDPTPLERWSSE